MGNSNSAPRRTDSGDDIDLLNIALVLAQNARVMLIGSLAAGLIALGISFLIPPTFVATTRILPPQQQQGAAAMLAQQLGSLAGLAGMSTGMKNPADIYVAMVQSRTVADRIIDRFKLVELYEVDYRDDAAKVLTEHTRVKAGKDGIITLEVEDHAPARAADIANTYVKELQELTKTLAVGEAAQRRLFFETQLQQTKTSLTQAEIALRASGVGASILKADPQAAIEGIARIRAEITAAEVRLASMRGYLTDSSAEIRQGHKELAALRAQLAKFEINEQGAPKEGGAEYIAKYRDYKYYETLFELMAKQYEMAKLDEAREGVLVQVIDPAKPPERKSKPKKALVAIASTIVAFLALAILALLRDAVRRARQDVDTSEKINDIWRALRGA